MGNSTGRGNTIFLSTLSLRRATPGARHANSQQEFLSTLSLRRATRVVEPGFANRLISIHALLAESDRAASITPTASRNFYPRSRCGERRQQPGGTTKTTYFYPRSPCGERQYQILDDTSGATFLSTLSLRRATARRALGFVDPDISIHALLAESDCYSLRHSTPCWHFYPRSPCGERLENTLSKIINRSISIHALLAESDQ